MNVSDYTLSELMAIVEVEDLNKDHIIENTNYYIRKYKNKNPALSVFFKEIQSQLLQYADELDPDSEDEDYNANEDTIRVEHTSSDVGEEEEEEEEEENESEDKGDGDVEGFSNMKFTKMMNEAKYNNAGDKAADEWFKNEYLTQKDKNQVDKITDRKQKVQVFGNQHVPMKREQIATTDTYNVLIKQDSLNPNLKNTINRFINLDSQFRQYTSGVDSTSTDYICDLSDTLKNVLSISLYSYQIPFSWYAIDAAYGNNTFWIYDAMTNITIPIVIPSGNYSQTQLANEVNKSFIKSGFTFVTKDPITKDSKGVYYDSTSGILSLLLIDGSYNGTLGSFNVTTDTQIIFYDFTGKLRCKTNCSNKSNEYFNNTLGWIMGYRLPYYYVDPSGNSAPCILNLNGTKYLILAIDDFAQNRVNNSLVSISQFSTTLKTPSYRAQDLPYNCVTPGQKGNNLSELIKGVKIDSLFNSQTSNTQNGLLIAGKYQQPYADTQIVMPSAPRTLTNAQIYTFNSINSNYNSTNYLAKPPTSSDILAIIPVKTSVGVATGSLLVEFSGSFKDSVRTYFGPVNIERLAIKLYDDKGNILNLNGNDWCVSLIAECLYHY
jgi:hypothetical protein